MRKSSVSFINTSVISLKLLELLLSDSTLGLHLLIYSTVRHFLPYYLLLLLNTIRTTRVYDLLPYQEWK